MGISLSNHEDRIKKLESISTTTKNVIDNLFKGSVTSYTIPNFSKYNFILVQAQSWLDGHGGNLLVSVPYMCDFWLHCGHVRDHSNCQININSNGVISTKDSNNTIKFVVGLKLYYNFSYNIYRLAVSISKSFLKCLIKIRN